MLSDAKSDGSIKGAYVSVSPTFSHITYDGNIVAVCGKNKAVIINAKKNFFKGKSYLRIHKLQLLVYDITVNITLGITIINVFKK